MQTTKTEKKTKMQPGYPAARLVAPTVARHLAGHAEAADARGVGALGPRPDVDTIEALIDGAFWASLQREEGRVPRISLAFIPPGGQSMVFDRPLRFQAKYLARLAPAVERPGIHLGVWPHGDELRVWGTTRLIPASTLVLEVVEPGLLVIKYKRGDEFDKFGTIAVLQGDRIMEVDEGGASLPDCPALLSSLLGFDAPLPSKGPTSVLAQLAVSMRAHGRGGSLILVPGGSDAWQESAAQPIPYRVQPYADLARLLRAEDDERTRPPWRDALHRAIETVAGLTAVDGATVLNECHEVLAFGVKLVRKRRSERVERVVVTAPVVGDAPRIVDPGALGGTRHLSAAQFVHDQRDALAMVASQDGRFTVFAWSPCEDMVHAHRVEMLLM
ncbi:putative sensor domain DACNV-containing protein [Longimicrobium sp.]|uniref:putative sensor domain DACNV-containing protein n=1 Tax=Longimicrobium sp. TaxID=2029185 RepID=UPI002CE94A01|nr:hypothetical protein [Longimicrobium sp.]HSU14609.1 hypothetical protein [Longimicrobium sp.]